jgi:tellurite resistance protein
MVCSKGNAMDENAKRNLRNVMVFALVDGKLSDQEKSFIESLRIKLGIDDAELRDIIQQVRINPKRVELPSDPVEAAETVRLMLDIAAADGEISDTERAVLVKVARRAGMEPSTVEAMLGTSAAGADDESEINARMDEIYAQFGRWDAATRRQKVVEIGGYGREAVVPLLRMLESYRVPEGAAGLLELKTLVTEELGKLGDDRAAYYLAQQVNIGDMDDEVTDANLRHAAAEALGRVVGQDFSRDQEGVKAARKWWFSVGIRQYDHLAY